MTLDALCSSLEGKSNPKGGEQQLQNRHAAKYTVGFLVWGCSWEGGRGEVASKTRGFY